MLQGLLTWQFSEAGGWSWPCGVGAAWRWLPRRWAATWGSGTTTGSRRSSRPRIPRGSSRRAFAFDRGYRRAASRWPPKTTKRNVDDGRGRPASFAASGLPSATARRSWCGVRSVSYCRNRRVVGRTCAPICLMCTTAARPVNCLYKRRAKTEKTADQEVSQIVCWKKFSLDGQLINIKYTMTCK